jgi:hypothetical protein
MKTYKYQSPVAWVAYMIMWAVLIVSYVYPFTGLDNLYPVNKILFIALWTMIWAVIFYKVVRDLIWNLRHPRTQWLEENGYKSFLNNNGREFGK